MTKNLLKKYLLEKAVQDGRFQKEIYIENLLYEEYLKGKIVVDQADFEIWIKKLTTENLKKRYLLERAYETGAYDKDNEHGELYVQEQLYRDMARGEVEFDEQGFQEWLIRLARNKRNFGKYLKDSGCFEQSKKIVELTESDIISTSEISLDIPTDIIISKAGSGCFSKPSSLYTDEHLLVNGIYDNQMLYLIRACQNGSFSIGYYGQSDSKYTQSVLDYYRNLRSFLGKIIEKREIDIIEDTILGSDKIYVLNYKTSYKPTCFNESLRGLPLTSRKPER